MIRLRALLFASHPGPSFAVTLITTLLAGQAGHWHSGLALVTAAMLAGQLSVGWSNDAVDAARDRAAGRTDKPAARGEIGARTLWLAAGCAITLALALSAAIGPLTLLYGVLAFAAAWGYNIGAKATPWSGAMYLIAFGLLPAYAMSSAAGHPAPQPVVIAAAGLVGLGAHFANVLPDLAADRDAGVRGLPQRIAARWGPAAVRGGALVLLLSASALLVIAARPGRQLVPVTGLCCAAGLGLAGAFGDGRLPFRAAMGIALVDVLVLVAGGVALSSAAPLPGVPGMAG
jgi:4-hydroxybenzoate polyprenyltransferase